MEAPEVPLEQVQEHVEHSAHAEHEAHGGHGGGGFIGFIAITTAILAAFAAVVSLLAGDHESEAMVCQMKASDQWGYYQAKGIKSGVLQSKIALLAAQGQKATEKDQQKIEQYEKDQESIKEKADELEKEAEAHLSKHKLLAPAVTMFQIAIAIGAISALTRKKAFWFVSLAFGLVGIGFFVKELLT